MTEKLQITKADIGNALHSTAKDHVTAVAADVYDEERGMYQSEINGEVEKKANATDVTSQMQAEQKRVNTELNKKFDKSSIVQETGEGENVTMSQKVVSDKLSNLSSIMLGTYYIEGGFNSTNHTFNEDKVYYHTDFIDVSTNILSINRNVRFIVYFNKNKEYLSHSENVIDNSMLENADFVSIVLMKEDAKSLMILCKKNGAIGNLSINLDTLKNNISTLENNIIDNITFLAGTYYIEGGFNSTNHTFNEDKVYYHTDFIDVSTNILSINRNVRFIVYFNKNKEYLSHSENVIDNSMLENADFVSIVLMKEDAKSLMITHSNKGDVATIKGDVDKKFKSLDNTFVPTTENGNILNPFSIEGAEIEGNIIKLSLNNKNSTIYVYSNITLPRGKIYFSFDVKLSANISNDDYKYYIGAPLVSDIKEFTTRESYLIPQNDRWVRLKAYITIEKECNANFVISFNNTIFEDGYLYIRNLMLTTNEEYKYSFIKPNPIKGYLSDDKIFRDGRKPIIWEAGGWNAEKKEFNTDNNYEHTQFISLESGILSISSFVGARFIIFYNIAKEVIKVLENPIDIEKSLIEDNDYVVLVYQKTSTQNLEVLNHEEALEEKIAANKEKINVLSGEAVLNKIYKNRYIMFGFVAGKGLVILGSSNMREWDLIEKKFFFNPQKILYNNGEKDIVNGFRDPSFIKIEDWFYFTYTVINLNEQTGVGNQIGFCRTKDFVNFEELDNLAIEDSEGTDFKNGWAWAPAFFRIDNKIYIVCGVSPTTTNYGGQNFYHYICEYDYKKHTLSKAFKTNISFIDCHIYFIDGHYYAIGSGNKIYKSNTLLSNNWTSINAAAVILHYEAQILTRLDDNRFLLIGQDVFNENDGINDQHLCYQILESLESSFSEKKPLSYYEDTLEWLHTQQNSQIHEVTHATIFDTRQWRDNNNNFVSD